MALSKEVRIDVVLLGERECLSYSKIVEHFNHCHPFRDPVILTAVGKVINKFEKQAAFWMNPV